MKPLSKKDIKARQEEAICPSCGQWSTTDFSPEELREKEWECSDCMNKRMTHPEDLPENRGQKEISKYSPEYQFLRKLVNLVVKEGVPPQEVLAITKSNPFNTIDDAGNMAAKIWSLATEKYHIPREWLIKKLPEKKANLKISKKDYWSKAICPTCGEYKYTDKTPKQREKSGWECTDCLEKKINKKADLKEYSNEVTKQVNNFIVTHPNIMNMVIEASKSFEDDKELYFWMMEVLGKNPDIHSIDMESGSTDELIKWEELAYAWFHTVKREEPLPGEKRIDIQNLPVLDKKQKFDELLDQLSAETDPQKKEQIKQHIERIKRAKLLKADLWPAQETAEDSTQPPQGYYAYQYGQDRDTSVSGPRPDDLPKEADEESPCVKCGHKKIDHWWSGQPEAWCKECDNEGRKLCKQYIPKQTKQASPETDHALAMSIGEDIVQKYFFEKGIRWSQVVQFIKDQAPQLTDEDIVTLKTDTKYKLEQYKIQINSKKKGLSLDKVLQILEQKGPKPIHVDYTDLTIEFADGSKMSFDQATRKSLELDKTSNEGNIDSGTGFYDSPYNFDMGKRPQSDQSIWPADTWLPRGTEEEDSQDPTNVMAFSKKEIKKQSGSVLDINGVRVFKNPTQEQAIILLGKSDENELRGLLDYFTNDLYLWDAYKLTHNEVRNALGIEEGVRKNEILYEWGAIDKNKINFIFNLQNKKIKEKNSLHKTVSSLKKAFLKISKPESGYVDNGNGYTCGRCAYFNSKENKCALVQGGIKVQGCCNYWDDKAQLKQEGAGYAKEESGYVEYPSVDYRCDECVFFDGKAKTCTKVEGEISPTASCNLWQPISNKESSLNKKADVSGKAVNDILALIEQTGGATYNLQQGSLAQTNNFAVSTHKDRERTSAIVDFDTIEGYINDNLDLLSDSNNSLGAWNHDNKVYLNVINTVPTKEEALKLAYDNQQIAIFSLKDMQEIPVGIPALSKKELNIVKKAEEQLLTQEQQDQIAASTSPVYNIALNNYASAVKRGHSKDRALAYAIDSVKTLEKIDPKKLVELANTYLRGLV